MYLLTEVCVDTAENGPKVDVRSTELLVLLILSRGGRIVGSRPGAFVWRSVSATPSASATLAWVYGNFSYQYTGISNAGIPLY